jgi:RNA polymerase sigma factor (sigma-70 family)
VGERGVRAVAHPVMRILNGNLAELARAELGVGQLLDRFVPQRDDEAYAAVVRRHGPMVLAVCRRLLRNPADADDAFQAAFLVLARKAGSLSTRSMLASWLHGVAFNTARRLRRANGRRANRERPLSDSPEPVAASVDVSDELLVILDEELARLPERYRATIVLCDLEGLTRKEAAQQLQCPEGTVAGRLARARTLLAARLASRGVAPSAGLLAILLSQRPASAMTIARINGVMGAIFTGAVSRRVAITVERVVAAMLIQKMKSLAIALLVIGVVTAASAGLFRASANAGADPEAPPTAKLATAEPRQPAGEVRELTVLPLHKLEAESAAKVIAETFKGKGVTVAPVAGEQTLLLYASAKQTRDVRDLLAKEAGMNKFVNLGFQSGHPISMLRGCTMHG